MSTWNDSMAKAFFTTAVDVTTLVSTERDKIKVGYPCPVQQADKTKSAEVFGKLESVTCEFTWDRHPRMPDSLYQHEVLKGNFLLKIEI